MNLSSHKAGAFGPEDVMTITRVFDLAVAQSDSLQERNRYALEILRLYRLGIKDEAVLLSLVTRIRFSETNAMARSLEGPV